MTKEAQKKDVIFPLARTGQSQRWAVRKPDGSVWLLADRK